MENNLFNYILSKQDEWRKIYESKRKITKYEKQKEEKRRVKVRKLLLKPVGDSEFIYDGEPNKMKSKRRRNMNAI
jgi:hypothetical protein